ncbi:MAG: DUF4351 domain-containing protein [Capsulimonadaceae bacterium]
MEALRKSTTYSQIVEQGRLEGKLEMVAKMLRRRFGPPNEALAERLATLSADQLDNLAELLMTMPDASDLTRWLSTQPPAAGA